jgi:hypothetical protein
MTQETAKPTLHTALPNLKEVFLTLTQGQHPLKICVFIASITNEFILELDILHAHNASVDLRHQMLGLAEEEVFLWSRRTEPQASSW